MIVLLTIIASILIFGLLVFVHELGHFLAAKLSGITVLEFALGFGTTLWSKEYKGTLYKYNLFPLGGYVSLDGERGSKAETTNNYRAKPLYIKLIVLFAGVFMNFILAVLLLAVYLINRNYTVAFVNVAPYNFIGTETTLSLPTSALITGIPDDSPAKGKLAVNEFIIKTNGQVIASVDAFEAFLKANRGEKVTLTVLTELEGQESNVDVVLNKPSDTIPALNVEFVETPAFYILRYPRNFTSAISHALNVFGYQIVAFAGLISSSVSKSSIQPLADNVDSVVGVSSFIGTIIDARAFSELLNLTAIVSLSLAFINILPLPVLDGGQAVLEIAEKIRGKPLNEKVIDKVTQVTFIILMGIGVLVIFKDVIQTGLMTNVINILTKALGR